MVETLLLAVSTGDTDRIAELTDAAAGVVDADGRVELLHVFDSERYEEVRARLGMDSFSETTPDDVARRNDVASEVAARLRDRGVDVTVRGAVGDAADSILRTAEEVDADLLVVGGRGRSKTGKLVFGSTAQEVLLEASVPVTFVKARTAERAPVEA